MLCDLNAKVRNEEELGVMGRYSLPGRNLIGERLLEISSEMEMVTGNMHFRKKGLMN